MKTDQELNAEAELCDFAGALAGMREGKRLSRAEWDVSGNWIGILSPESRSSPIGIYMYTPNQHRDGHPVPWEASQDDLLAFDWHVVT